MGVDNESRCSQQSRSPSDNSTNSNQLLRLSLSAIHAKMEESLSSKLQKHGIRQLTPEKVPCSRRYMACRRTYKLVLLISSVVTFMTYCYYYHFYFHATSTSPSNNNQSKVSSPRLIVNQYDHYDQDD